MVSFAVTLLMEKMTKSTIVTVDPVVYLGNLQCFHLEQSWISILLVLHEGNNLRGE
jgi:hypothetical protein